MSGSDFPTYCISTKELAYGFVDSDKVIEQACGESISTIFAKEGELGFRNVETQVLNAIGQRHSLVVATGGGLITKSQNWGVLHQGIVIWLAPSREKLFQRLQSDPRSRPLLKHKNSLPMFENLYEERERFYKEADLEVKIFDETPFEVAKLILKNLPSILSKPEDLGAQQTTEG